MSDNKQENTVKIKGMLEVNSATNTIVTEVKAEQPKVETQAEVKAEVKIETKPAEVKQEAPKNRLIDGAVEALNKKLDFRI